MTEVVESPPRSLDEMSGREEDVDTDFEKVIYDDSDKDSIVGERLQGDGQENENPLQKKMDDDEDRRNPQYIPKRGVFYEHDDRTAEGNVGTGQGEGDGQGAPPPVTVPNKKKIWDESSDSKWKHDLYVEDEQLPKSKQELINAYGYDIRNEDGPPRARRRRRYGRGPNKYTRNWEDEEAYGRSGPPRGGGRPGGQRKPPPKEAFPPLIPTEQDLEEPSEKPTTILNETQNEQSRSPKKINGMRKPTTKDYNSKPRTPVTPKPRNEAPKQRYENSKYKEGSKPQRNEATIPRYRTEQISKSQYNEDSELVNSPIHTKIFEKDSTQELEVDLAALKIDSDSVYSKQDSTVTPIPAPRLQTEPQRAGPKRYSSLRQRSLPETTAPPFTPPTPTPAPPAPYYQQGVSEYHQPVPGPAAPQHLIAQPSPQSILTQGGPITLPPHQQLVYTPPAYPQYGAYYPPPPPPAPYAPPELYQAQGGITYYSPHGQAPPRAPLKRPKAAIPILAPPDAPARGRGRSTNQTSSGSPSPIPGIRPDMMLEEVPTPVEYFEDARES